MTYLSRTHVLVIWAGTLLVIAGAAAVFSTARLANAVEQPSVADLISDAAVADGLTVENGTEVVRQQKEIQGITWTLVSYESNVGSCLAAFAAEATNDIGMVGSCGLDSSGRLESSWTVGMLTAKTDLVGVAFGMVEPGVDSVFVTLSDGTRQMATMAGGTWLGVFDASDERAVSRIAGMTDAATLVGEVVVESRPEPVHIEEHDH